MGLCSCPTLCLYCHIIRRRILRLCGMGKDRTEEPLLPTHTSPAAEQTQAQPSQQQWHGVPDPNAPQEEPSWDDWSNEAKEELQSAPATREARQEMKIESLFDQMAPTISKQKKVLAKGAETTTKAQGHRTAVLAPAGTSRGARLAVDAAMASGGSELGEWEDDVENGGDGDADGWENGDDDLDLQALKAMQREKAREERQRRNEERRTALRIAKGKPRQ
eukprot:m.105317 g.105317  ORF g.105317 m.105317 type:complete len:220 (+) comp16864_c0_seq1:144-803(+)